MLPWKREGEGKETQIREADALRSGHELHTAMAGGGSPLQEASRRSEYGPGLPHILAWKEMHTARARRKNEGIGRE